MSLFDEQAAFMLDLVALVNYADTLGYKVSGRELGRTAEQQAIYVRNGRSQTMNSNHLRNCAIDLYFMKDGKLVQDAVALGFLGSYWEQRNPKNRWGGNWKSFKDTPHFERQP